MSEEKLTSNTLEIEEKRLSNLSAANEKKESYKTISEDKLDVSIETAKNSNMVRENGDSVQDGADEKMLGSGDKEALALKNIDVKFISGEQNANGDAKIEIGNVEKAFTGMTKEELMKYANDPFWVKLRWVLFIAFWALWIAMLVGAILIIVMAPKCAAPTPLAWYQKGPLVTIKDNESDDNIEKMKKLNVQAVIYELPAEETYFVEENPDIQAKIRGLVQKYQVNDIKVVLDVTPNYVLQNDTLFLKAKDAEANDEVLNAFITTTEEEITWRKVGGSENSFVKIGKHKFLSQFGDNIDLRMDSPQAQEKFKNVLSKLVEFGVSGFRLHNAKHLKIGEIKNEDVNKDGGHGAALGNYGFYEHKYSTYVDGLGDLLYTFTKHVHNITNNEGFLTVIDPISMVMGDKLTIKGTNQFGIDLPTINLDGMFAETQPSTSIALKIFNNFENFNTTIQPFSNIWMQWQIKKDNNLESTAFFMFTSFLRGVQVAPLETFTEINEEMVKELALAREKAAIQHGSFDFFISSDKNAFGYARIKSGNPGFFVVVNPSNEEVHANFKADVIGSEMDVFMRSKNYENTLTKAKYMSNDIQLPPKSTAIFTFVPK